jgi:chromosome segregation ATPase
MIILVIPLFSQAQGAKNVSFQRQVLEQFAQLKLQMAKLEEGQKALNQRIDDMNQRMNDMNQRIDNLRSELKGDIGDLRSELRGDIVDLRGLVYVALGGIITLICGLIAMIGFVLWDRRTAIAPVVRRTGELEKEFDEEKDNVMRVFKEYAKVEPRFAEVLKTVGML